MIEVRPKAELGGSDIGWLKARHHFRIGEFGHPTHQPIGNLIVWNDDEIAPGSGFPTHGHANMEIITYVREGTVSHRDSLGNAGQIEAGDVQAMSAGSGITHTEWNAHDSTAKVFQIWIKPRTRGGQPGWDTKEFPKQDRAGHWVILASGYNDAEALALRGDARVVGVTLQAAQSIVYRLDGRSAYLVPAAGKILLDGHTVNAGDGCVIQDQPSLRVEAVEDSEIVLVDIGAGAGTRIVPHD
jgi:redox-sensitive bicupin YhaK (pirin superfamily)